MKCLPSQALGAQWVWIKTAQLSGVDSLGRGDLQANRQLWHRVIITTLREEEGLWDGASFLRHLGNFLEEMKFQLVPED